jgi:hypothetical protein
MSIVKLRMKLKRTANGMCDVARQAPLLWVLRDHHYQGVRSHMDTMAAAADQLRA